MQNCSQTCENRVPKTNDLTRGHLPTSLKDPSNLSFSQRHPSLLGSSISAPLRPCPFRMQRSSARASVRAWNAQRTWKATSKHFVQLISHHLIVGINMSSLARFIRFQYYHRSVEVLETLKSPALESLWAIWRKGAQG